MKRNVSSTKFSYRNRLKCDGEAGIAQVADMSTANSVEKLIECSSICTARTEDGSQRVHETAPSGTSICASISAFSLEITILTIGS